ncbi:MAG: hypothetical protein WAN39_01100, partial [Candidatus Cybelea sp.]
MRRSTRTPRGNSPGGRLGLLCAAALAGCSGGIPAGTGDGMPPAAFGGAGTAHIKHIVLIV